MCMQVCPGHSSYIYAWISKLFDTCFPRGGEVLFERSHKLACPGHNSYICA